jgi:hypothetical protein
VEVHYATDGWLTVGSGSMNLKAGSAVAGGPVPYKFLVPFFWLTFKNFSFFIFEFSTFYSHFYFGFISGQF